MLEEIKQALRLFMLLGKKGHCHGGLLVLLWAEPGTANVTVIYVDSWEWKRKQSPPICGAVAAAGSKWKRIRPETVQNGTISEPDPEDLRTFTDAHGSLKLILSFQIKDASCFSPEWSARIKAFLSVFSLANGAIRVHLLCKFPQQVIQQEFRANFTRRLTLAMKASLMFDVTCRSITNKVVKNGSWCPGGHPFPGSMLPLSIPPETMDSGLYGELSMQLVTLLSPCVLQYPNLETLLTHAEVFAYTPTNAPITFSSAFFRNLPTHLDCQEFGQRILHCSSDTARRQVLQDRSHEGSIVYAVEHQTCQEPEKRLHLQHIKQKLLVFLFLQHTDPFASQLSDFMVTDALIEHHLEDILNNNRRAVTGALQTEFSNTLKAQDRKKKDREKLLSAAEVILSASVSIVSCSTNWNFRQACWSRMQVNDTHELAASLQEALLRVISWRCVPKNGCYSAQVEEHPENSDDTRAES
ncbi:type 2 DNA topoisomerase 6 subunit B-like isoform X2 [Vanacampus margaritifer]